MTFFSSLFGVELLCLPFQGIHEVNLEHYYHGGINITGFKLVDFTKDIMREFLHSWSILNPDTWTGAGKRHIAVSSLYHVVCLWYGYDVPMTPAYFQLSIMLCVYHPQFQFQFPFCTHHVR